MQPLLGVLKGRNGLIAILLGPLPGGTLRRQLALEPTMCLILSDPLMGQFGLKSLDRRSRFLKQVFCGRRASTGTTLMLLPLISFVLITV